MPTAHIGMGANLASHAGAPEFTLAAAATRLHSLGHVVARSSLYSTSPVGFADQPRFINAVVALETELSPHALLHRLLRIEKEFGRDRASSFQNGPRTLDLDILLLGRIQLDEPGLQVPHPRIAERAFVLIPLHEIAPSVVIAGCGKTVTQLLQSIRSTGVDAPDVVVQDAVVQVESEVWRAGADRDAADPAAPPRTIPGRPDPGDPESGDPDRHH